MPRRESEEEDDALSPPGFSTPTKVIRNDEAGHAEPDAEGTESESDADVEKQFDESTGKKREYHPFRQYTEVKQTGSEPELETEEIHHEIYSCMKMFMQQSRLMKAPGHKQNATDVGLWKLQRQEYHNSRTDEWIRVYQCPMHATEALIRRVAAAMECIQSTGSRPCFVVSPSSTRRAASK